MSENYATRQNYELDEIERLTAEVEEFTRGYFYWRQEAINTENSFDAIKLEAQAAFTEALLSLADYAPSGGFVAPSNVRRILVRLADRLGVEL